MSGLTNNSEYLDLNSCNPSSFYSFALVQVYIYRVVEGGILSRKKAHKPHVTPPLMTSEPMDVVKMLFLLLSVSFQGSDRQRCCDSRVPDSREPKVMRKCVFLCVSQCVEGHKVRIFSAPLSYAALSAVIVMSS